MGENAELYAAFGLAGMPEEDQEDTARVLRIHLDLKTPGTFLPIISVKCTEWARKGSILAYLRKTLKMLQESSEKEQNEVSIRFIMLWPSDSI